MKKILFFLSLALLVGCTNDSQKTIEKEVEVIKTSDKATYAAGSKATLGIEGMACEINCVGKVKKALEALEGVSTVEVEFDAEKTMDYAHISFDGKVSEEDMIAAVEELHDGMYQVKTIEIEIEKTEHEENSHEEDEETTADEVSAVHQMREIEIPNIFDVVRVLLN